ncbi:MAG TPA: universal stress protein [Solirubrobacterales bacterium]|nr:universal stress protein [Solirubrobacterales bacterium]
MAHTKQADRHSEYTSPTAAAPVLVGADGSEEGRDALALARELSALRGARCLIAVPGPGPIGEEAREALDDPRAPVEEIGFTSSGKVLAKIAERDQVGTVVVGSSHRGAIGRAMLGSVGEQVLGHAPCEVVVAPRGYATGEPRHFRRIAVAVDGSEESKVALTRAEDLARQAGATIEVLVADDPMVLGIQAEYPSDAPAELADVLKAAVASVDPNLSPVGKRVETGWHQVVRTIAAAIAGACEADVDLLVTGCRRPINHFLSGSVTRHLITEAPCPVLVVPHSRKV